MFHRVRPAEPVAFGLPDCYRLRGTSLTPGEFEQALDEAGPVLPLKAVEDALHAGEAPPPGVVLTFDDGYREHIDLVAPLLASRGATGTFYVATGLHGADEAVAAVDAWYWLLDNARRPMARVELPDGCIFSARLDSEAGKREWVIGTPKHALLGASPAAQQRLLSALAGALGVALPSDLARRLYMTPAEWRGLAALGMGLGAHSVTHPRLTEIDGDQLAAEVTNSLRGVVQIAGPAAFAYPDGEHNAAVVALVRQAGATSAATCIAGPVERGCDAMRLPRMFVSPRPAETRQ
jgi:peptidoglycan/xylan/chitin deacetylase (PgdA/CDA1 family)